jgi:hypothetical protein
MILEVAWRAQVPHLLLPKLSCLLANNAHNLMEVALVANVPLYILQGEVVVVHFEIVMLNWDHNLIVTLEMSCLVVLHYSIEMILPPTAQDLTPNLVAKAYCNL